MPSFIRVEKVLAGDTALSVPVVKGISHLPVVIDPSHSSGRKNLVAPLAKAAIAVGADGFKIDVHPSPDMAKVDGAQALLPSDFAELMASGIKSAPVIFSRIRSKL